MRWIEANLSKASLQLREVHVTRALETSIANDGLFDAPIVWQDGDTYVVVDGFKRLQACHDDIVAVRLLPHQVTALQAHALRLKLNPRIQCDILSADTQPLFQELAAASSEEAFTTLEHVGIKHTGAAYQAIKIFAVLPSNLKQTFCDKQIDLNHIKLLGHVSADTIARLAALSEMKASGSQWRRLLALISDLPDQQGQVDQALQAGRRYQDIEADLLTLRNPEKTTLKERIHEHWRQLQFSKKVSIDFDLEVEKPKSIRIDFQTAADLEQSIAKIASRLEDNQLKELVDKI